MAVFGKPNALILSLLEKRGFKSDNMILTLSTDMDKEHNHIDSVIGVTADTLFVLSGYEGVEKASNGGLDRVLHETDYHTYALSQITNLVLEELLSTSRIVLKDENDTPHLLAVMSNFCKTDANLFIKYFERVKKGEITSPDFTLDFSDLDDDFRCPKCGMRYPDRNRKVCPRCMEKGKLYARFGLFLARYKWKMVLLVLSLAMLTGASIAVPYFSKGFFLDNVLTEGGSLYGEVLLAIGIIVATQIFAQIADIINGIVSTKIAVRVILDLKKTIFSAINRLSLGFFTGRQTGGLMTQVNTDSNTIYMFFCDGVPYLLINVVQVAVLSVILFIMNPLLAAASLATVPLYFFLLRLTYNHSKKLNAAKYSASRVMSAGLSDVIGGIRVVKAFAQEESEINKFEKINRFAARSNRKLGVFNNWTTPAIGYVLYIGNIIALGLGGYMVMKKMLTYGELITFTAYINMIYAPINFFSNMINWSASCTNALQRLFEIHDTEPDISEREDAVSPEAIRGEVEFRDVSFGYTKQRKVLKNVNFSVEAGSILGIVGHTGAGKSTIANLIMRLYDTDDGGVYIDGANVRDMSFKALYENIAIVSQETYLFMGTILDNIKYACPDA
ncbi:MAG: ABC transporter ATP-binding protein, partial [Clostridia bacterium]|nr:ABC transporter ATP-binding protein [Clostridia bacterium]